jgi:3D (Asp-Asp-Asp) domain-containing protein
MGALRLPSCLVAITVTFFAIVGRADTQSVADFLLAPPAKYGEPIRLWATHYFVHSTSAQNLGYPLRDKNGNAISENLSPREWCLGAIEGTIRVESPKRAETFNFHDSKGPPQVDCAQVLRIDPKRKKWINAVGRSTFRIARGPFGDGVKNYVLVPYRTIAVDPKKVPYGTVLFIPKARGVRLLTASGKAVTHDGYFFAGDTGGAIKGDHIDVFCGNSSSNCFSDFIGSSVGSTFEAYIISDTDIISDLAHIHLQ